MDTAIAHSVNGFQDRTLSSTSRRVRRILSLYRLLAKCPNISIEQIAMDIGVSRRTVFRDLNILKSINLDPRNTDHFLVLVFPFTDDELEALQNLYQVLNEGSGQNGYQVDDLMSVRTAIGKVIKAS